MSNMVSVPNTAQSGMASSTKGARRATISCCGQRRRAMRAATTSDSSPKSGAVRRALKAFTPNRRHPSSIIQKSRGGLWL